MGSRFTTKKPEYVYFWGTGQYINGPYVNPQRGRPNVKYRLMKDEEFEARQKLIELYEAQIMDLTIMSKIELGDDVIAEIKRLKELLNG